MAADKVDLDCTVSQNPCTYLSSHRQQFSMATQRWYTVACCVEHGNGDWGLLNLFIATAASERCYISSRPRLVSDIRHAAPNATAAMTKLKEDF